MTRLPLCLAAALALALTACPAIGGMGQRVCPDEFDCAALVEASCGADERCADSGSCEAAQQLAADGDDAVCRTAWCDLGESYRECGLFAD